MDSSRFQSISRSVILILMLTGWAFGQYQTQPAKKAQPKGESKPEVTPDDPEAEASGPFDGNLTGDWGGVRTKLQQAGVDVQLSLDTTYQNNVHGGLDTKDAQRFVGLYDLGITLDLEKLLKLKGAQLYVLGEGGFGHGLEFAGKIDDIFGVNDNTVGYRSLDAVELWYQQNLFDNTLQLRLGKIDLSGGFECRGCPVGFDGNSYANDATSQFLNSALCNNPTIPFPDQGIGAIIHYNPIEWFYTTLGAADAQANFTQTGLNTAFHDEDYFIYLYEFGFVPQIPSKKGPLTGAYRFGLWYDPQPKEQAFKNPRNSRPARFRRDDVGFYTSFDQMIFREKQDSDQGLGLFFRYGFAHGDTNQIEDFWSVGGQYKGLIPRRDEDVLGLGVAQGILAHELGYTRGVNPGRETVIETYYNIKIVNGLTLSPDVQYVIDPGGLHNGNDFVVVGMRLHLDL